MQLRAFHGILGWEPGVALLPQLPPRLPSAVLRTQDFARLRRVRLSTNPHWAKSLGHMCSGRDGWAASADFNQKVCEDKQHPDGGDENPHGAVFVIKEAVPHPCFPAHPALSTAYAQNQLCHADDDHYRQKKENKVVLHAVNLA